MYKTIKTILNYIVCMIMLFGISSANAALVEFSLEGTIDIADTDNLFNVTAGDTIYATGFFDDSLLISSGTGSVSNILITVGDLAFNDSMETFGSGEITLDAFGDLNDLTYQAIEGANTASASFDSNFTNFFGSSLNGPKVKGNPTALDIQGHWNTATFTVVPIPAAVWLFGSGLLGLAGVARRKAA